MIEKLDLNEVDPRNTFPESINDLFLKCQDKINEIIDWLNKADPSNYYVDMSMKIDNEQQDWRSNEMQNGFVEEKEYTIGENEEIYKQYNIIGHTHISETEQLCKVIRQLQQKQPDQECIEWLQEKIDRYIYYKTMYPDKVDMWDVEIMKKLLKYFKEIK